MRSIVNFQQKDSKTVTVSDTDTISIKDKKDVRQSYKFDCIYQNESLRIINEKEMVDLFPSLQKDKSAVIFTFNSQFSNVSNTSTNMEATIKYLTEMLKMLFPVVSEKGLIMKMNALKLYNEKLFCLIEPPNREISLLINENGCSYQGAKELYEKDHLNSMPATLYYLVMNYIDTNSIKYISIPESQKTNKSIFTLSKVFDELKRKQTVISYRESKLTRLLSPSLSIHHLPYILSILYILDTSLSHPSQISIQNAYKIINTITTNHNNTKNKAINNNHDNNINNNNHNIENDNNKNNNNTEKTSSTILTNHQQASTVSTVSTENTDLLVSPDVSPTLNPITPTISLQSPLFIPPPPSPHTTPSASPAPIDSPHSRGNTPKKDITTPPRLSLSNNNTPGTDLQSIRKSMSLLRSPEERYIQHLPTSTIDARLSEKRVFSDESIRKIRVIEQRMEDQNGTLPIINPPVDLVQARVYIEKGIEMEKLEKPQESLLYMNKAIELIPNNIFLSDYIKKLKTQVDEEQNEMISDFGNTIPETKTASLDSNHHETSILGDTNLNNDTINNNTSSISDANNKSITISSNNDIKSDKQDVYIDIEREEHLVKNLNSAYDEE
ncbi:hypothetical protein WA158_004773 [Blastocystis sp. Blastoise]